MSQMYGVMREGNYLSHKKHHKYIRREMINGKWRYWYEDPKIQNKISQAEAQLAEEQKKAKISPLEVDAFKRDVMTDASKIQLKDLESANILPKSFDKSKYEGSVGAFFEESTHDPLNGDWLLSMENSKTGNSVTLHLSEDDVRKLARSVRNRENESDVRHSECLIYGIARGADPYEYVEDELCHYGILGQKWGIRRTPEQLGHRVKKLESNNRELETRLDKLNGAATANFHKSIKIGQKNEKEQRKISRARQSMYRIEKKLDKITNGGKDSDPGKMLKYEKKIAKQQKKIHKSINKLKHNPYQIKYEACTDLANRTKRRIDKNNRMIRTLNNTINAINDGTIEQGKYFMRYED